MFHLSDHLSDQSHGDSILPSPAQWILGKSMTLQNSAPHFLPSLNQVIKELKREENSLYNCINSIVIDTAFVQQIAGIYPELPVFANLRCGRWYTPDPDGTCYFKSTDGHFGEWNFSTTRLNLHLALSASKKGGCIVVDATRRGKTFPVACLPSLRFKIALSVLVIPRKAVILRLK